MKVLVADDSPLYRKMLEQLLVGWGYSVMLAKDGNEALALLTAEAPPTVAILDGMMPGLTGPELCKTVRGGEGAYVYIILLSADDHDDDVENGFALGADDYLRKPFREFELRARLTVATRLLETRAPVCALCKCGPESLGSHGDRHSR